MHSVLGCLDSDSAVLLLQEPKQLFDEVKTIPISKLDRGATLKSIKKYIDDELAK